MVVVWWIGCVVDKIGGVVYRVPRREPNNEVRGGVPVALVK